MEEAPTAPLTESNHLLPPPPQTFSRVLIILLALIGFAIMGYLTYTHYANAQSFCDISETVSCDVVTTSLFSEIFGWPISLAGLAFFALILYLALGRFTPQIFRTIYFLALFFLIPSLYFTFVELLVIKALCILCESTKLITLLILITALAARPRNGQALGGLSAFTVFVGLTYAAVIFFAQTGNVVKADYSQYVQDLNRAGVVYYKSVKCNNCKRQERLFGEAIKELNSIECHPDGLNPRPELCLAKAITKTPTFILEPEGVELKRLVGLQKLETIASFAQVTFQRDD